MLTEEEALTLKALEAFNDIPIVQDKAAQRGDLAGKARRPGDKWTVYGPCEYIPPLEATVVSRCHAIFHIEGVDITVFSIGNTILFVLMVLVLLYGAGRYLF